MILYCLVFYVPIILIQSCSNKTKTIFPNFVAKRVTSQLRIQ